MLKDGRDTPLMAASYNGDMKIVQCLLKAGALVNLQDLVRLYSGSTDASIFCTVSKQIKGANIVYGTTSVLYLRKSILSQI